MNNVSIAEHFDAACVTTSFIFVATKQQALLIQREKSQSWYTLLLVMTKSSDIKYLDEKLNVF